ncbi:PepSY-associated TM helix domain-containing protein [Nguyenibacter sp. L1]|uniref:PepSY-associated TM helix domain-containing protein n=1 Tax=Nguyenibacter sp. L1 TaxID=3049350 RepID=UPI002B45AEE6|nr:PepSY-associated TM helix domain-containing protein [Nguyenibacter sp. L1]WRH89343.1 PepSY-associated TM helix domain-containing protein [Nguyenibacter sp. L1]
MTPAVSRKSFRRINRWIHGILGLVFGCVLTVMGVTGVLNRRTAVLQGPPTPPLSPDALIRAVRAAHPAVVADRLRMEPDPGRAWMLRIADPDRGAAARWVYVDPRDGRNLGPLRAQGFFDLVRDIHRFLAVPGGGKGKGRIVAGMAALALIYFTLSGLYLLAETTIQPARLARARFLHVPAG